MRHHSGRRSVLAAAGIAAAVTVGLGLTGCAAAAGPVDVLHGADPTPTVTVEPTDEPTAPATTPPPGDGAGGSGSTGGSGSGGGSGSPGGTPPHNEPPYVRDIYPDAFLTTDDETGEEIIGAIVQGHAYDPDGPDHQENTKRVKISWGDGTSSDASLEGHGAFNAWHSYSLSYAGQTLMVRVVAYGHDGQTATVMVALELPEN